MVYPHRSSSSPDSLLCIVFAFVYLSHFASVWIVDVAASLVVDSNAIAVFSPVVLWVPSVRICDVMLLTVVVLEHHKGQSYCGCNHFPIWYKKVRVEHDEKLVHLDLVSATGWGLRFECAISDNMSFKCEGASLLQQYLPVVCSSSLIGLYRRVPGGETDTTRAFFRASKHTMVEGWFTSSTHYTTVVPAVRVPYSVPPR